MDFLKEALLTFTKKDRDEFGYFLARKNPKIKRKDVHLFGQLYDNYHNPLPIKKIAKGQNYHALRKRLSKELVQYLILKKTTLDKQNWDRDGVLIMTKYFMHLGKHQVAWELLQKEEPIAEKMQNYTLNLKIQSLKLEIMPYYGGDYFETTKSKMIALQIKQTRMHEFQMYFIQMQNELRNKMEEGDLESPKELLENVLNDFKEIKDVEIEPRIHLKIIEIIRSEYLIQRRYTSFAKVAKEYYENIIDAIERSMENRDVLGQLEYIMAHAYFRIRNFKMSGLHLERLNKLMLDNEIVKSNFNIRYISLISSINVFNGNVNQAIDSHNHLLKDSKSKLSLKEELNLSLNLVAYYCTANRFSDANKLMLFMAESDNYYQKNMGREWLVRQKLIKSLLQLELGNIEIALSILGSIKKKHKTMLKIEKYDIVRYFIDALIIYINDPDEITESSLSNLETKITFRKDKLFEDPKLLAFYAWFKSKVLNVKLYDVLLEEYNVLE